MTREEREEAIEILKDDRYYHLDARIRKALDMAIKALEALEADFTADDARVLFNRCLTLMPPVMCWHCGLSEKCKKYRGIMKK